MSPLARAAVWLFTLTVVIGLWTLAAVLVIAPGPVGGQP